MRDSTLRYVIAFLIAIAAVSSGRAQEKKDEGAKDQAAEAKPEAKPGAKPEARPGADSPKGEPKDAKDHPKPPEAAKGPDKSGVWGKDLPESIDELLAIQKQLQSRLEHCRKATVNILGGSGSGSGVIVSEDGLVLTAGHISEKPDREVVVTFEDGTKTKGITLGASWLVDSGMIQITETGKKWPHVDIAKGIHYQVGDWCFALGYPDGYQKDRGIVVRLGRVLVKESHTIQSDCRLLGGDSGGPLFNMKGDVIGIHSRISFNLEDNYHAPIEAFVLDWKKLLTGKVEKFELDRSKRGFFGVVTEQSDDGVMVAEVLAESPALKAGVKVGDLVLKVNNRSVSEPKEFSMFIGSNRIGDKVVIEIKRDQELKVIEVVLAKWPKFPFIEP